MKKYGFYITLILTANTVIAQNNSGAYINLNSGIATQQFLPSGSFAGTLNAGYNFNRYFALEGGYASTIASQFGTAQYNNIFDIAAKGTIVLSSVFSLYGRIGTGLDYASWSGMANVGAPNWYCQNNSNVNFVGLAGLGGSFKLSKHFDLRLEDNLYIPIGGGNPNSGQINAILVGSQFNF